MIMIDLGKIIEKELKILEGRIKQAAAERDESATPTESAHDQTRQIANQLYNSLLEERKKLQELKVVARDYQTIVKILNKESGKSQRYLVVPNGMGGTQEDDVILLSEKTPLAKNISGKKDGAEFDLNGQILRIEKIEENI